MNCQTSTCSQYTVVDEVKINSALTEGEDIADLGGLILAWMAWKDQTKNMDLAQRDGLSPEQRFFVGYALSTRTQEAQALIAETVAVKRLGQSVHYASRSVVESQ